MYKNNKFIIAAAAIITAASLAACGDAKEHTVSEEESNIVSETPTAADQNASASSDTESIKDSDVKKLESEQESEASNAENTDSEADNTESDNTNSGEDKLEPTSFDVGGLTLSAKELSFKKSVNLKSSDHADAALFGDELYILDGKQLKTYTLGDTVSEESSVELPGTYSRVDTDPYGQIYLSRDRFDSAVINTSGEINKLGTSGILSLSKVMEYGLCTNGGKVTKYEDSDSGEWSSVAENDNEFPENVSAVEFAGNHILIAHKTDGNSAVKVCDYDGNELVSTDGGSTGDDIEAVTEAGGVIAASSNGDLTLWDASGDIIGRLDSDDTAKLLGTDYPVVIKKLFAREDGSILAFCTSDEKNGKGAQARMFTISAV